MSTNWRSTYLVAFAAGLLVSIALSMSVAEDGGSTGPRDGPELAVIFIGSSTCAASTDRELPGFVEDVLRRTSRVADSLGIGFTSAGIALDLTVEEGIEYLESIGEFAEISTGRGWANIGALRYVWEDIPGRAATPQLVVVARDLVFGGSNSSVGIAEEHLVARKVGIEEIRAWINEGVSIPEVQYLNRITLERP